jgi:Flp pilus assembly pilin Flp
VGVHALGPTCRAIPGSRKEQRAMKRIFLEFWRDESGTAAIEYGIIAAMVSVPLVHSAQVVTVAINATFEKIIDAMN